MIRDNVKEILSHLPSGVDLVAASKTRTPGEILEAIDSGVEIIGENYIQEGAKAFGVIGRRARWHFIGHLQRNKVKQAVEIFDVIETVDSLRLAREISKRCISAGKDMKVLVEINSAAERQKNGVMPDKAEALVREIALLERISVAGLMTMGPLTGDPENARPYFKVARKIFEELKSKNIPGVNMIHLSMGMTNSYMTAIEEGSNIVRIGTKIFGDR